MMNGVVVIFILSSFCLHIAADQNQLRGKTGVIPSSTRLRRLKGTSSRRVEENEPPWLESTTTEATSPATIATDTATGELLSEASTAANSSGVSY